MERWYTIFLFFQLCLTLLATLFDLFGRKFAPNTKGGLCEFLQKCPPPPSNLPLTWLGHNNYRCLAEPGLSWRERSLLAFSWKELVRHCCLVEYRQREDKKSICLFKLTPTLHSLVQFINE